MTRTTGTAARKTDSCRRSQQAASIAATLAWAVEHGSPVADALQSLLPSRGRRRLTYVLGLPFVSLIFFPFFRRRWQYYDRIEKTIAALQAGVDLPGALRRHLGAILPRSFIVGLEVAVDEDRERELIPILARTVVGMPQTEGELGMTCWYVIVVFALGAISQGFLLFIVPRLRLMMFALEDESIPVVTKAFFMGAPWLAQMVSLLFVLAGLFALVLVPAYALARARLTARHGADVGVLRFLYYQLDYVAGWIPVVGPAIRLRNHLDAAQIAHAYLVSGMPAVDAADGVIAALDGAPIARRWRRFVTLHEDGVALEQALCRARICHPLSAWIGSCQHGARGLPEAFHHEVQFLTTRLRHALRRRHNALFIGSTLAAGLFVGLMLSAVFQWLTAITNAMLTMRA